MNKKLFSIMLSSVLALLLTACSDISRVQDMQSFNQQMIPAGVSSADFVKDVKVAGLKTGWVVSDVKPGLMNATLNVREHRVAVQIPYTKTAYDIRYQDSTNLLYNSQKNTIHRAYNKWVITFNRNIQEEFLNAQAAKK